MADFDAILQGLKALYPDAGPELNFTNPYETLVATILSAQCTDKRVNMVTPAVFRDFPDPAAMAQTTPEILFPYVKSCGFTSKAKNIVAACKIIVEKHGGKIPSTMEELTALPGVGRKTANVVLANAFHVPAIAVDTHVFRVSNRLGLANAKSVEETEKQLMQNIPREDWRDAHHWLIFHGRRVCHSQRPDCANCTLRPLCKKAQQDG
ncbi:MAG: endonuclease III [Clostridiales bacterium]|nr:endonuclease III [Clostridiales bacterium]